MYVKLSDASVVKKGKAWYQRHINDPYVKEAQAKGYRSRAVFKLMELQKNHHFLKPGQIVVDLGAAPGGWSAFAAQSVQPGGQVIAIDLLPMDPIDSVAFIQADFASPEGFEQLTTLLPTPKVDGVISDMAPNLSGIAISDQLRSIQLAAAAFEFAQRHVQPEGYFVTKLFQGQGFDAFVKELRQVFKKVQIIKPDASRNNSREVYLFARSFRAILD